MAFSATVTLQRPTYVRRAYDFDDTSARTPLGLMNPVVSPDGQSVAFSALGNLWISDTNRGTTRALTDDPYASFPLITYQENVLTLAETSARLGNFDQALDYLNEYRSFLNDGGYLDATYQESFALTYAPYVAADFAAGGLENADGLSADEALLREIVEERYVTFYGQTIAWNDERRVRNTTAAIPLEPSNGNELPWRFVYSQDEINGNPNVPSPVPGPFASMSIYE